MSKHYNIFRFNFYFLSEIICKINAILYLYNNSTFERSNQILDLLSNAKIRKNENVFNHFVHDYFED